MRYGTEQVGTVQDTGGEVTGSSPVVASISSSNLEFGRVAESYRQIRKPHGVAAVEAVLFGGMVEGVAVVVLKHLPRAAG